MARAVNVEITPRRNEHPERMIKRFSRKVKKEGILEECRERMYYTKKSAKRRREKYLRKRKAQLAQQKNEVKLNKPNNMKRRRK